MWNELNTTYQLKNFMEKHCFLHDSCVKEMNYLSGAYVDKDLSMIPINSKRCLRMIIQRQSQDASVIEIEFQGLKYLKLQPATENYTCEILNSTMLLGNDYILWYDCGELPKCDLAVYSGTIICASKARWRVLNNYLGDKAIYDISHP